MVLKVRSKTDVITNSSSEVYMIRNSGKACDIMAKFQEYLEEHAEEYGLEDPDRCEWIGIWDYYAEDKEDGVEFGYEVLCNLDDCYGYLCELFGKDNVEDIRW